LNPDYCNSNEFEKAVDYNDILYCKPENKVNPIKKTGWYIYSLIYRRPAISLEPFKYCPWYSKKLAKPWHMRLPVVKGIIPAGVSRMNELD
jgi:hypothetical protein